MNAGEARKCGCRVGTSEVIQKLGMKRARGLARVRQQRRARRRLVARKKEEIRYLMELDD